MAQENPSSPNNNMATDQSSSRDAQLIALRARQAALESTVSQFESQRTSLVNSLCPSDMPQPDEARAKAAVDNANQRIKSQITQLQQYNDIKDIGTQLMGLIAEKRACRIVDVQEHFGIDADD